MRTTLTLEDDVAAALERLRLERRSSFKGLINQVLREGLRSLKEPPARRLEFRTRSADLGICRFQELDNIAELLAVAEGESFP